MLKARSLLFVGVVSVGAININQNQTTVTTPVKWETSFESAKVRAAKEKKPILLLQMFGKLDEEFC